MRLVIGALLAVVGLGGTSGGATQTAAVTEVAMAAPDIIHVVLRDPAFERGRIIELDTPRPEPVGTWVRHGGEWGIVIGLRKDHLRLADVPPTAFLDRDTVDDAGGYAAIGNRSVVAVHRKSMPYDSGVFRAENGDIRSGASFQHDLYLKLDGPLPPGDHVIDWPGDTVADTGFAFDPGTTRASSLHVTQNGHRATDLGKSAYLSLWLPGAGAVDFRGYDIDSFDIVDAAGAVVFSAPIRLRAAPDTPEPGNGFAEPLLDYADSAAEPVRLDRLAGGVFETARPHGFVVGQRIILERLGGEMDAGALFATVATATPTGFSVSDPSSEVPQAIAAGAKATPALRANRAATFVFELDYSGWQPAADGVYYLRIAGLGVSDPLVIGDDVWRKAAFTHLSGLYHHRSGVALDGRFGFSRPAAFRPGADFTVYRSRLPLAWSSEFEGFIHFSEGAGPNWVTAEAAPQSYWGGYMDAGDWDRRIQHLEVAGLLLQVHDFTPTDRWIRGSGLPKSAEALDPALYEESDVLPELVHEAIWTLDFYRRLQEPDGSIRGGIESAEHPERGVPSYLENKTVFVYAPDHLSSFKYAAAAADLARILKSLDAEALARVYEDSAVAAWRAGERGFIDPDAYYAEALRAAEPAGVFAEIPWATRRDEMQRRAADYRTTAAAALSRLTRDGQYAAIFEEHWRRGLSFYGPTTDAAWAYLQSATPDPAIAADIEARFQQEALLIVAAQADLAYPGLKHPGAPVGWGQGGAPGYYELQVLMRTHRLTGDPAILRALEQGHHVMLGANQLGLSLTTGLGVRAVGNPLHEDRIAMGVLPPAGITIYGWAPQQSTAHGWIFGPPWSPLTELGTDEAAAQRRVEPPRFSLPYLEYLVQHPAVVMQQEYTVHQSIGTMAALALYIDAQ